MRALKKDWLPVKANQMAHWAATNLLKQHTPLVEVIKKTQYLGLNASCCTMPLSTFNSFFSHIRLIK